MSIAGVFKNAIKSAVGIDKDPTTGELRNEGFTTIYEAPNASALTAMTSYVIECDIACTGASGVQASVRVKKASGVKAYVVKSAPIPVGSAIQVINGQKLVLEPGDALEVKCDTSDSTVDVIVSLVENVNI